MSVNLSVNNQLIVQGTLVPSDTSTFKSYIDASLSQRDASINILYTNDASLFNDTSIAKDDISSIENINNFLLYRTSIIDTSSNGYIKLDAYMRNYDDIICDASNNFLIYDDASVYDGSQAQINVIGDGNNNLSFINISNINPAITFNNTLNMVNEIYFIAVKGKAKYQITDQYLLT